MEKCTCQEDRFLQGCLSSARLLLFFNDCSLARIPQFSSSNSPQKLAHTLMRLIRGSLLPLWLWVSVFKPAAVNFRANKNLSQAYAFVLRSKPLNEMFPLTGLHLSCQRVRNMKYRQWSEKMTIWDVFTDRK